MQHTLTIRLEKKLSAGESCLPDGILACQPITVRERLLRLLFGKPRKMMILVPGDTVREIEINDDLERKEKHE